MRFDKLLANRFMDRTATILSRVLDIRSANQQIISGNLANIDTPGFKAREFHFEEALQRAGDKAKIHLKTTDSRHISPSSLPQVGDIEIRQTDRLNLDMEMAKMMRNNLLYETSTKLLRKKFQALRSAIESGRR